MNKKKLAKLISLIEGLNKNNENLIFRGINIVCSKKKDRISSSLYRWAKEENGIKFSTAYHPYHIEKEIVDSASRYFPESTKEGEILTEIQHYKGKTNLIDFTRNLHIALYFACFEETENEMGKAKMDGELFIFKPKPTAYKINYKELPTETEIVEPAITQNSKSRVIFQSSVFVYPIKGYIDTAKIKAIPIEKDLKKEVLNWLEKYHNINNKTIYNDFIGFVQNEEEYKTSAVYLYKGSAERMKQTIKGLKAAIKHFDKAIELNPKLAKAYSNRAKARKKLKKLESSKNPNPKPVSTDNNLDISKHTEKNISLEVDKESKEFFNEIIYDYNQAIKFNPHLGDVFYNRGTSKLGLKKYKEAINDFDVAISHNPSFDNSYYNRGNAWLALKHYDNAIKDFSKAIEINPKNSSAYSNRGRASIELEQYNNAIGDYNNAIKIDPNDLSAFNNRAIAFFHLNNYQKALEDINKAIDDDAQNVKILCNRGTILLKLKKYDEAINDYNEAIKIDPMYAGAYCNRAETWLMLKEYPKAIKDSNKAINLDPELAEAYCNRAETWLMLKEYPKAIKDSNKAINLDPELAEAYCNRGGANAFLNHYKEALSDCNIAIEMKLELADAYYYRGIAKSGLSDKKGAKADFKKAKALGCLFHIPNGFS